VDLRVKIQLEPHIEEVVDLGDYWSIRGTYAIHTVDLPFDAYSHAPDGDEGARQEWFSAVSIMLNDIDLSRNASEHLPRCEFDRLFQHLPDSDALINFVSDDTRFCVLLKKAGEVYHDPAWGSEATLKPNEELIPQILQFENSVESRSVGVMLGEIVEDGGQTPIWTNESSCVNEVFSSFYKNFLLARDDSGKEELLLMQMCSETMNWNEMEHVLMNEVHAQNRKTTRFKRKCLIPDDLLILDAETALSLTGLGFSHQDGLYLERSMLIEEFIPEDGERPPSGATLHDYIMLTEGRHMFVLRENSRLTREGVGKTLLSGVYVLKYSSNTEATEVFVANTIDVLKEVQVSYIRNRVSLARKVGAIDTAPPQTINRTNTNTGRYIKTDRKHMGRGI